MTISNTLGARVAAYRRSAGYEKAEDFADAINNPRITKSVIQNIESGRKADISVSELLEIARTLGLSPVFLLANMSNRAAPVNLANVGEEINALTADQMDLWLSQTLGSPYPGENGSNWAKSATHAVHLQRAIRNFVDDWNRISGDDETADHQRLDTARSAQRAVRAVEQRYPFVDLAWLPPDLMHLITEVERLDEIDLARRNNYAGYEDMIQGAQIYGDD